MKWQDLPNRATISMGKADVEKLRGGSAKMFVSGMVVGAIALLVLQGTTTAEVTKPDKPVVQTTSSFVKN